MRIPHIQTHAIHTLSHSNLTVHAAHSRSYEQTCLYLLNRRAKVNWNNIKCIGVHMWTPVQQFNHVDQQYIYAQNKAWKYSEGKSKTHNYCSTRIVEVMFDFILEMCSFSRLFASIIYERIFGVVRQYVNIATSESTIKCLPMHQSHRIPIFRTGTIWCWTQMWCSIKSMYSKRMSWKTSLFCTPYWTRWSIAARLCTRNWRISFPISREMSILSLTNIISEYQVISIVVLWIGDDWCFFCLGIRMWSVCPVKQPMTVTTVPFVWQHNGTTNICRRRVTAPSTRIQFVLSCWLTIRKIARKQTQTIFCVARWVTTWRHLISIQRYKTNCRTKTTRAVWIGRQFSHHI